MRLRIVFVAWLLVCMVASGARGQLSTGTTAPFGQKSSIAPQACSATEASCAEAAAKIIPQIMGPSPIEENLRRLTDGVGGRVSGSPEMAKAVDWAVEAFRAEDI